MANENQQPSSDVEGRLASLEKQMAALQNSSTISYNIDKSFVGRGFMKVSKPPVFFIGADQGSWINGQTGLGMAFPSYMGIIDEGPLAGLWIPLYVPPRAIT